MKAFRLENEPKIDSGFKIPDGYFDTLSTEVLAQLDKKDANVFLLRRRKKAILMLVAASVLIALMIPIVNNYNNTAKELDSETLETYLSYQSTLNQYDLIKELDNTDIQKLGKNVALEDETLEDFLTTSPNIENLISE